MLKKFRILLCLFIVHALVFPPTAYAQNDDEDKIDQAFLFLKQLSLDRKLNSNLPTSATGSGVGAMYFFLKAGNFKVDAVNVLRTVSIRFRYWAALEPNARKSLTALFYNLYADNRPSTFFQDAITKYSNVSVEELGLRDLRVFPGLDAPMKDFINNLIPARIEFQELYNSRYTNLYPTDMTKFNELLQTSFDRSLTSPELQHFYQLENRFDAISKLILDEAAVTPTSPLRDNWIWAKQLDQIFTNKSESRVKQTLQLIKNFSRKNKNFSLNQYQLMERCGMRPTNERMAVVLSAKEIEALKASRSEFKNLVEKTESTLRIGPGATVFSGVLILGALLAFASDDVGFPALTEKHFENMDDNQILDELSENIKDVDRIVTLAKSISANSILKQ